MLPLTDARQGPGKSLLWSQPMDQAFNTAKSALAAKLKHPQGDIPISLMVDASNTHASAALQHFRHSSWAPLSFFSKNLNFHASPLPTFCLSSTTKRSPPRRQHVLQQRHWQLIRVPRRQETPHQRACTALFHLHGCRSSSSTTAQHLMLFSEESSHPFSPWYLWLPPSARLTIFLARHESGRQSLGLSCLDYQRSKVARHVHPLVCGIDMPSRRFSHIHDNLVGPYYQTAVSLTSSPSWTILHVGLPPTTSNNTCIVPLLSGSLVLGSLPL